MPVHFYSPVPDIRDLRRRREIWEQPFSLTGVDMRPPSQLFLMTDVIARYQSECDFPRRPTSCPYDFYTENVFFGYASAAAMHSITRYFRPRRVVEVGGGNSSLVIAAAARRNAAEGHSADVSVIDPQPSDVLVAGVPGISRLFSQKVESVDTSIFDELEENDILSIDTSHTVKIGGEVPYLYLEVLPRLRPGVLVHVHDIFLPEQYPRQLILERYFWNEQYLLHAFLIGNRFYEVAWAQRYSELTFPAEYHRTFAGRTDMTENNRSYSLWMRRTSVALP